MHVSKIRISWLQFILMINSIQVGVSTVSLPRVLAEKAGTSSWIAIIFGGILSTIGSVLIVKVREYAPFETFPSFFNSFFGKVIGKLFTLLFSIYYLVFGYLILIRAILYVKTYLLQQTGITILVILLLIPALQLAIGDIRLLAKYVEFLFPMTLFTYSMLLFTLKDSNIHYILPIIKDGWLPIFKAIPLTVFSFLGIEIIYFLYPYLEKKEKAISGVIIANLLTTCMYLFVTFICFVVYSPDEILYIFDPVLAILNVLEFQYVERLDVVIIAFAIINISTTWIPFFWFGLQGVSEVFQVKKFIFMVLSIYLLFIIVSNFFTPTFTNNQVGIKYISNIGMYIIISLPIVLWICHKLKSKFLLR
ncbi:GerAB/ArcD/ProY family transporter [Bacillus sp. EAC]|uniref:GerAB/ArcD/ProY family transporter n=1 Tax=Bacillus sp. EAC TaxID=1978338 RepID=UPI000B43ED63|nr:GerAB/ArcD/ProY family transporter [Bacillus sp. EAC]